MRVLCIAVVSAVVTSCSPPAPVTITCAMTVLPNCTAGPDRFSDEACLGLDDALTRTNPLSDQAHSANITAPVEGATVPSATPITFTWDAVMFAQAPHTPTPSLAPQHRAYTFTDELRRWLTLIPEAQAHCQVFNGVAYTLVFRSNGRPVLRAGMSTTSYTPDTIAWSTLTQAAQPIELTILAAKFVTDRPEMDRVYTSAPRRFTISR